MAFWFLNSSSAFLPSFMVSLLKVFLVFRLLLKSEI